jgi:hypothetical protein
MSKIVPFVTGVSTLAFNWQNTIESLERILSKKHHHHHPEANKKSWFATLLEKENIIQAINPARLILFISIPPLRALLFLGHILSIGVTGDQIPKVSKGLSIGLGSGSELLEDYHYFFGHDHHHHHTHEVAEVPTLDHLLETRLESEHGHNHDLDLPTKLLKITFSPLYLVATLWDWGFSQFNPRGPRAARPADLPSKRTFREAANVQMGLSHDHAHAPAEEIPTEAVNHSLPLKWLIESKKQHIADYVDSHFNHPLAKPTLVKAKKTVLADLQTHLNQVESPQDLQQLLTVAANNADISKHRFFGAGTTASQDFLLSEATSITARQQ